MSLRCCVLLPFLIAAALAAESERVPLAFAQITLQDGRRLEQVVVRTYDPATDTLLVVANGTAQSVPLALVPEAMARALRESAPLSNGSVSYVSDWPFAPDDSQRPPPDENAPAANAAEHRSAALVRAERYFRYELQPGWSVVTLNALDLDPGEPQPMAGGPGRYRTTGTAYLEWYDERSRSFLHTTTRFTALTEQWPGQPVRVAGFVVR